MSPRLEFAIRAAHEAGRLTLEAFLRTQNPDVKPDGSLVTEADHEAERTLRSLIEQEFPGEAILGEEQGQEAEAATKWVIDPIDGTKSFVAGVPLYAVLLSYEVEAETEIGVCYLPALDQMIYAERGKGAFCNGRRIAAAGERDVAQRVLCSGSMSTFIDQGRLDALIEVSKQFGTHRTWCDAYGHVLVAMGRAEAMLDPRVSPWDVSATSLIVTEAGARFSTFDGRQTIGNDAIAAAPHVYEGLILAFGKN